jgi:hypothetical protein
MASSDLASDLASGPDDRLVDLTGDQLRERDLRS